MTTQLGSRLAAVDLPPARLNLPELEHALALVDLAEELLKAHPGSSWITERELRRDGIRSHRTEGMTARPVRMRTADGVLVLGDQRFAVELDLTPKRTEQYEQLVRAYAADRTIEGLMWFGPSDQACQRIASLVQRYDLTDFAKIYRWKGQLRRSDLAVGM